MMSAVQPFLSGAISKTVNMPRESTIDEIMQTYVEAWKLGLKAIAIYRDGSKRTQPLNTSAGDTRIKTAPGRETPRPVQHKLPVERQAITHKFNIAGHEGYITVGIARRGVLGTQFEHGQAASSSLGSRTRLQAAAVRVNIQPTRSVPR